MTRYGLHLVHGGLPLGQHGGRTMTFTRRGKTGPVPAAVFGDTGSWKTASRARWRPASEVEPAIYFRPPPLSKPKGSVRSGANPYGTDWTDHSGYSAASENRLDGFVK
jgi:hypothetical protein